MKKLNTIILTCAVLISVNTSCNTEIKNMETKNDSITTSVFPLGDKGPSEWFTGEVHIQTLVTPDQIEDLYSVGQVTFEAGGKTNWHTHPIGQVLLVTEGKGWYQERGKQAQQLVPGSVVTIPKDVEHWHGAAKDSKMVHIAISNMKDGTPVTWMNPVTDEEYNNL